ncbi:hypothetical protein [Terriglobus aquaticus]|uniref:Uncharacterized protein n=1 Tax=Terriglobus aquaticus TaxID=940139 RepID=A0ABW9KNM6_9BACT|nr:hypothetical protein [Terriglobus aquaticus]
MLDVHPPEHAPHGVRDFFLHIFTITVGLLIALGLESLVEWRHHVHLGHQAAETMRRELEANRKDLAEALGHVPEEQRNLKDLLQFSKQKEKGTATNLSSIRMGMSIATLHDASWQTASATGALSYIPYEEAERFAAAYTLQKQFLEVQNGALQPAIALEALLGTEDPNSMEAGHAREVSAGIRTMMASIETQREIGHDLDKVYDEALREQ